MSRRAGTARRLGRGGLLAALAAALPLMGAGPPDPLTALDAQRQARVVDRDSAAARAGQAAAEVRKLRAQLVSLGAAEASGRRRMGGARARLEALNLKEAELHVRMARNQQSLTRLLGALQMYQRDPPPALLVTPRSARDAVRATLLIKAITPELEDRARGFAAQSEALKGIRRQADAASGELFQDESVVADRQARIEVLIEQKIALEAQLHADAGQADADVRRLAARARSLGELVQTLDARRRPAAVSGGAASDDAPDDAMPARLTPPVQGQIAHGFREAAADPGHAQGMSWTADAGATVSSPLAANVDYAGPLKGWGLVLILRAGDYHLVLAGLGVVSAQTGRTVAAGEPVGTLPADPAHPELYLEVRRGARPVDPSRWLSASGTTAAGGGGLQGGGQRGRE